ncbi:hypothetical protein RAN67_02290 [Acinetobacter baumannii]|uniref:hypothetical protein n=1 Tax=Acinetobacter baumannii TaxID=470 RepID=UPI001D184992|nr:hypothetical protein [Acinetobacter baumannii]MCF4168912.1 hypothetical protein [Acinetobacter baumannii]MDC4781849.1 hypothetical protein [Acinetobacter baumannii]MDP8557231.1 hypothetical protein [Acinetobacter baumannii]
MSGTKLSQRQLVLIRRAAEDAIHACNRHYGPFVDVVAHPLNICALVDMAQLSVGLQVKVERLQGQLERVGYTDNGGELMKPPIGKAPRFDLLDDLKNSLNKLAQKYRAESHELSLIRDFEKSQMYSHFANQLDQLLKG